MSGVSIEVKKEVLTQYEKYCDRLSVKGRNEELWEDLKEDVRRATGETLRFYDLRKVVLDGEWEMKDRLEVAIVKKKLGEEEVEESLEEWEWYSYFKYFRKYTIGYESELRKKRGPLREDVEVQEPQMDEAGTSTKEERPLVRYDDVFLAAYDKAGPGLHAFQVDEATRNILLEVAKDYPRTITKEGANDQKESYECISRTVFAKTMKKIPGYAVPLVLKDTEKALTSDLKKLIEDEKLSPEQVNQEIEKLYPFFELGRQMLETYEKEMWKNRRKAEANVQATADASSDEADQSDSLDDHIVAVDQDPPTNFADDIDIAHDLPTVSRQNPRPTSTATAYQDASSAGKPSMFDFQTGIVSIPKQKSSQSVKRKAQVDQADRLELSAIFDDRYPLTGPRNDVFDEDLSSAGSSSLSLVSNSSSSSAHQTGSSTSATSFSESETLVQAILAVEAGNSARRTTTDTPTETIGSCSDTVASQRNESDYKSYAIDLTSIIGLRAKRPKMDEVAGPSSSVRKESSPEQSTSSGVSFENSKAFNQNYGDEMEMDNVEDNDIDANEPESDSITNTSSSGSPPMAGNYADMDDYDNAPDVADARERSPLYFSDSSDDELNDDSSDDDQSDDSSDDEERDAFSDEEEMEDAERFDEEDGVPQDEEEMDEGEQPDDEIDATQDEEHMGEGEQSAEEGFPSTSRRAKSEVYVTYINISDATRFAIAELAQKYPLLLDRPNTEFDERKKLSDEVFAKTEQRVRTHDIDKFIKVLQNGLKQKLISVILTKKLNKEDIETGLETWKFYQYFKYYREQLKDFEAELWEERENPPTPLDPSSSLATRRTRSNRLWHVSPPPASSSASTSSNGPAAFVDDAELRRSLPVAVVICRSTSRFRPASDRVKVMDAFVAEVPASCTEAIRAGKYGIQIRSLEKGKKKEEEGRDYPGIPHRKFNKRMEPRYGKNSEGNSFAVQAIFEKKSRQKKWYLYYEGWTIRYIKTEQDLKMEAEDTLAAGKLRRRFLMHLEKNGANEKLIKEYRYCGDKKANSLLWDFEDLSYFHCKIQEENGLGPVSYIGVNDVYRKAPNYAYTTVNIMDVRVYNDIMTFQSQKPFEDLPELDCSVKVPKYTGCENPHGCVCNRRFETLYGEFEIQNLQTINGLLNTINLQRDDHRLSIECTDACGCSHNCPRRHMQRGNQKALIVNYENSMKGMGLRAGADYVAGEFIGEYTGILKVPNQGDNQSYEAAVTNIGEGRKLVICARTHGNIIRFMSHSCSPNAAFVETWSRAEESDPFIPRIGVFATKDIKFGEEVTICYWTQEDLEGIAEKDKIACWCQAANCMKKIPIASSDWNK